MVGVFNEKGWFGREGLFWVDFEAHERLVVVASMSLILKRAIDED